VDFPTIQVVAQYPGASPDVMASSVTTRWNDSSARSAGWHNDLRDSFANSTITLQFTSTAHCCRIADVQAAINAARGVLPRWPSPPTYNKVNPPTRPSSRSRSRRTRCRWKCQRLADTRASRKTQRSQRGWPWTIEGIRNLPCACA